MATYFYHYFKNLCVLALHDDVLISSSYIYLSGIYCHLLCFLKCCERYGSLDRYSFMISNVHLSSLIYVPTHTHTQTYTRAHIHILLYMYIFFSLSAYFVSVSVCIFHCLTIYLFIITISSFSLFISLSINLSGSLRLPIHLQINPKSPY